MQTEEDLKKKEDLELMVERVKSDQPELVKAALELLKNEIRSSTSSMTAVPKPLKFLRAHRNELVETHARMAASPNKVRSPCPILHLICADRALHSRRYGLFSYFFLLNRFNWTFCPPLFALSANVLHS